MNFRFLFMSLCYLGWFLIVGCTAPVETVATIAITRVTPETATPTATFAPATPTVTPFPTDPATPTLRPTLSTADVEATYAALEAVFTPSPTATPTATFTPIPGPVWPILFAAGPCPTSRDRCDSQSDVYTQGWGWYQIYSDGSGLRPVPQLNTHPEFRVWAVRFADDGSAMAYWGWEEQEYHLFLTDLHNDNRIEITSLPLDQIPLWGGFDFLSGTDCLILYWRSDINQSRDIEETSVEQICPDDLEPQVLDVVEFPDVWPRFAHGYLSSPQGDALLIYGPDRDYNRYLYIQELGVETPPRLLFFIPVQENTFFGPMHWISDGQQIEFILNARHSDDSVTLTRHVVDREGQELENQYLTDAPFALGGAWSPNGREVVFFSGLSDWKPETTGLYIFDLESGTWRQILAGYYLIEPPSWSPELP